MAMPERCRGSATWAVAGIVNEFQSFPARHNSATRLKRIASNRRTRRAGGIHAVENQINRATFAIETVVQVTTQKLPLWIGESA
jgi:hypothetical protein